MRILCIGREGQVARALVERAQTRSAQLTAIGRPQLDLIDGRSIQDHIDRVKPDLIINAAAYTAVDAAETDMETAKAVNETAVGGLADIAAKNGLPLVHYSTDYVFDGTSPAPYGETDPVCPRSIYGQTKLAGEQAVAARLNAHLIFRTAWVYSPFGSNFVKTMLRVAQTRETVSVVDDQIGNPTNALDLAEATLEICEQVYVGPSQQLWGLYHMTGSGAVTWAEFASAIFAESEKNGGPSAQVLPIPSTDYPTPVERPKNSQLSTEKLTSTFGITLPEWQKSVARTVQRLLTEGDTSQ